MKPRFHSSLPVLPMVIALGGITAGSAATWNGDTSASWATSGNWTGTAPDNTTPQAVLFDANSDANLTQTLDGSYTLTGITLTSPTGAVIVNNGAGTNLLTLGSGGIDLSSATQNLTLNVNTTVGATQSWNVASGRSLLRSGGTTSFGTGTTTTFSGSGIVEFGGSQALTGSGDLLIDGASLYNNLQAGSSSSGRTGTTTLNSGIIRISTSISMFGTGAINLNGGAIGSFSTTGRVIGSNDVNIGGNIQIGGTSPLSTGFIRFDGATNLGGATREITAIASTVNTNFGSGAIFTGVISNGGITKAGGGIMTLTNDGNTFTGATTINAGNLAVSNGALANSSSVTLANSGAVISLGINGATTVNNFSGVSGSQVRTDFTITGTAGDRILSVNQTTDGTFAGSFVQGSSRPISLVKSGSATLTLTGTGTYSGTTTVNNGTLKIGGAGLLGGGTYSGNITNDATLHFDSTATQTLAGAISGSGTLLKSNTGTLSLTGSSDYTGNTLVSGGTLVINGNISTSTLTTVQTGATLGGSGTVGALTVDGGGILAPGTSPGTLGTGTLTLADTSVLNFELNPSDITVGLGINDLVAVTGDLTLDGVLNVAATSGDFLSAIGGTTWRLFDYSGNLTDNSLTLGTMPVLGAGLEWSVDATTAGQVNLIVIPEPGAALLGGIGLLFLLRRRR